MPLPAARTLFRISNTLLVMLLFFCATAQAQKRRRPPAGGKVAVVVDERPAALREAPDLSAALVQRLGRGRLVAVSGVKVSPGDGVRFYRVGLTRRTGGWLQAESVVQPSRAGDDERLLRLVRASRDFDLLARARIFLEAFPRSPLRPAVLLLFGDEAEEVAARLTREAARRLDAREMEAGGAPPRSYFLNFNGLDRFNRLGVRFVFEGPARRFRYDGAAWREILRRHPRSPEAAEARRRLEALNAGAL